MSIRNDTGWLMASDLFACVISKAFIFSSRSSKGASEVQFIIRVIIGFMRLYVLIHMNILIGLLTLRVWVIRVKCQWWFQVRLVSSLLMLWILIGLFGFIDHVLGGHRCSMTYRYGLL